MTRPILGWLLASSCGWMRFCEYWIRTAIALCEKIIWNLKPNFNGSVLQCGAYTLDGRHGRKTFASLIMRPLSNRTATETHQHFEPENAFYASKKNEKNIKRWFFSSISLPNRSAVTVQSLKFRLWTSKSKLSSPESKLFESTSKCLTLNFRVSYDTGVA